MLRTRVIEPAAEQALVLTMGVFDGVHLGHRHLVGRVVDRARALGCRSGVVIFHPHPAAVLRGEAQPLLTSPEERARLLQALGVDLVVPVDFTPELSRLSARDFMEMLGTRVRARELWVGPDFALGRGREGDIVRLTAIGREMGFSVHTVPPLETEGGIVSSTRIRGLLASGDVAGAARLLGRCFAFGGEVIHGAERGRALGYPTANLAAEAGRALPTDGIYACRCQVSATNALPGQTYDSVVNVGTRPTFDNGARLVEAYLLDYSGDLYGRAITLHFVARLRGELRFTSIGGLVEQIGRDVAHAREVLAGEGNCAPD